MTAPLFKLDLHHPSYQDNWLIHCQIGLVPSILPRQFTDPLSNWTCTIHLIRTIDWSIVKLDLYHPSYQDNWLIHCQIGLVPSILPGKLSGPLSNWNCTIHLPGQLTAPLSNWNCTIHLIRTIDWSIVKLDLCHPSYQDNWLLHCQIGLAPSILSGQLTAPLSNRNWPSILPGQLTASLSNWTCTIHLTRTIDWSIVKLGLLGLYHPSYQDNWLIHCQIGLVPSILSGQLTASLSNWTCTIHLTRAIDWSIVKLDLYHPSYQDNWLLHCQIGLVPSILPGQFTASLSNWTCTLHLIRTIDCSIFKLDLHHPSYQDNWLIHCQIGLVGSCTIHLIRTIDCSIFKLDLHHPSYQEFTDPLDLYHPSVDWIVKLDLYHPSYQDWIVKLDLYHPIVWSIVKLELYHPPSMTIDCSIVKLELYHPSYQDNWLLHCQIGLAPSILPGQLTDPLSNWTCTIHLTRKIDWSIVKLELYHPSSQDNWLIHC